MHSRLPVPVPLCLLLLLPSVLPATMPGGLSPRDVTDPEVQEAAVFAVEEYNARSTNSNYFKALRVVEAQSQVVSGAKYYLTMELVKTNCQKIAGNPKVYQEIQNCRLPPRNRQEKLTCHFEVWSRPWLKTTLLTKVTCN
ncbi:cystatin-1 [Protobothrops mucrosquamatus]|uniref:cystatin-1 n=1 Tax=Protobothrops mucrosquamatus TaxID=103944 RepID=UPI000775CC55|nr:cystatin-1 [Protobothrops mucrosquamatus]